MPVSIDPGTITPIATDLVGTHEYQKIKVDLGAAGATSPLVRGQLTGANSLPVVLASDQALALPSGAATAAHQVTQNTALAAIQVAAEALDNTVAGSELQVDVVTSALPSGASTSANQTTIIGHVDGIEALLTTIDADTSALFGAVAGSEFQVDVVGSLPAGANNIGDVDVLTVPADPFGANADAASATGSISAKLRFIAATGIPVTGTVAVTQSGTWDEVGINDSGNSITVDAPVATPVFVRLSDGAAAITTLPVSLASAPSTAVTNAGTFVTQIDGAALTALQLIDNAVSGSEFQVDVVAALPAGTNAIGKVDHASTGLGHGVTTVTTAGTDVVLAGSTAAKWVTVQSQTDNTSLIAVGATGVDATIATGTGIILYPGDSITLQIDNLADVFIDSLVNGEGVRYSYGT